MSCTWNNPRKALAAWSVAFGLAGGTTASGAIWTATGSMVTNHRACLATLLPSGKVLVTVGFHGPPTSSTELFDLSTSTWTATGSMTTPRQVSSATLLQNGKVLVAGGLVDSDQLSSAELYDPAAGTWTATGSMTEGRGVHTATLLPNGKVLVASFNTAELYDPGTGTWAVTGPLVSGRFGHLATLLPNGKVLVAGSVTVGLPYSAELYDPASGTWTPTGSMTSLHSSVASTMTLLPNGKVLVAGGDYASAELYDPVTGAWTVTDSMAHSRTFAGATLLPNGKVLVAGGETFATAELYDNSDTTAPTASPAQLPAPNGAGWNNSDVTVSWNWADNAGGSGINAAQCTTSSVSSGEGASLNLSATCKDLANNTGTASRTVKVDKTAPMLSAPLNVVANATSPAGTVLGEATLGAATASDALSGPPAVVRTGVPAGSLFPIGNTTLTHTATDAAGNSIQRTQTVAVKGASEQLTDLTSTTASLPNPPRNSLLAPLNAAATQIANNNLTPACNQLSAFINSVNAKVPNELTSAQAAQFTAAAAQIRAALGCAP